MSERQHEIELPVCAITRGHCHLQGVRYNAMPCTLVCDLEPSTSPESQATP